MRHVTSKDGTKIVYDRAGEGDPIVLIDGALCSRSFGPMPRLASLLAPQFTVITYDRRGRGESGDTLPYALGREIDDIEALIDATGGSAFLFGTSSGGSLALEAALALGASKVGRLAIYEAPYNTDSATRQRAIEYRKELNGLLAAGRRGDAAAAFMRLVGTPAGQIDGMRQTPVWQAFEAVAPTLAYDNAALGDDGAVPVERAACISMPSLVMSGDASPTTMRDPAKLLAGAIPGAEHRELAGQRHDVDLQVLAPVLIEFFAAGQRRRQPGTRAA
jgi:pimeloyl-ACP methyl ester carboxylesterase